MKIHCEIIECSDYFDGSVLHRKGPYTILVENGIYHSILHGSLEANESLLPDAFRTASRSSCSFLIPGMTEAHCHVFLDGDELEQTKRSGYLKQPREELLKVAWENIDKYRQSGIRIIRDAGDIHGINTELRDVLRGSDMKLICAGRGIRRKKRYGSFMAHEVEDRSAIVETVKKLAEKADVIKIILTGIIDFENGVVKDPFQFDLEETRLIVDTAHDLGLKTFAHCSGREGLKIAAGAGVDSIEHGFFMDEEILDEMSSKKIAWVPTFIPVHFQWAHPEYCGWNATAVSKLGEILANHRRCLSLAHQKGVALLSGSDGGSYGVRHAEGLLEELKLMRDAGLADEAVLDSTVNAPRRHFSLPEEYIKPGAKAGHVILSQYPL